MPAARGRSSRLTLLMPVIVSYRCTACITGPRATKQRVWGSGSRVGSVKSLCWRRMRLSAASVAMYKLDSRVGWRVLRDCGQQGLETWIQTPPEFGGLHQWAGIVPQLRSNQTHKASAAAFHHALGCNCKLACGTSMWYCTYRQRTNAQQ